MDIFFDCKIKSKIFLTILFYTFLKISPVIQREWNDRRIHLCHISWIFRFAQDDTKNNPRNTYFFIFIYGLKQVKLPLHSISKSQNFIHNFLIFHHLNLFSPLVNLTVHRLFLVHFEWLNAQKPELFTRVELTFENYFFCLQGFWKLEVRFLYLEFYFQNGFELVTLKRHSLYILRWKSLNLKLKKFTKRKVFPTSVILRL